MKKLVVLIGMCFLFAGCGSIENAGHGLFAELVKVDRQITLFSADGRVLKIWKGRYNIHSEGGMIYFVDHGKSVLINGTFTVEEI